MVKQGDFVVIFHSIHRVMKAEKLLKAAKTDILLIPVPRQLSSDCGLAIRITAAENQRVQALLADAELPPAEIYVLLAEGYESVD